MSCRDWMTANPRVCLADDPAAEAARIMKQEDVGPVPVVQDRQEKRLVGIVTDRDLALRIVAEGRNPNSVRVGDIMSSNPVTCQPEDDERQVMEALSRYRVRRIPVVDGAGRLVGIVSQADVARHASDRQTAGSRIFGSASTALIGGFCIGLGAGLMFVLDPARGRRRRALIRDQAVHITRQSGDFVSRLAQDLRNRAQGTVATTRAMFRNVEVSDAQLEARVRARLGRTISHPHAVKVSATNGRVILDGPILEAEAGRLLKVVSAVEGVREVENRLTLHSTEENVPGLQGRRQRSEHADISQPNWAPTARVLATAAGGGLLLLGVVKRKK